MEFKIIEPEGLNWTVTESCSDGEGVQSGRAIRLHLEVSSRSSAPRCQKPLLHGRCVVKPRWLD